MANDRDLMTDRELDALLAHASAPPHAWGARERLMDRLAAENRVAAAATNVVPLRKPARSRLGWLAGLPLAASLAFGIYLGSAGGAGSYLPTTAYDLIAGASSDEAVTGIEDIESFTEDDLS